MIVFILLLVWIAVGFAVAFLAGAFIHEGMGDDEE